MNKKIHSKFRNIINSLSLPKRLHKESYENYDNLKNKTSNMINKNILFGGPSGSGKTIFSINILINSALYNYPNKEEVRDSYKFLKNDFFENFEYIFINVPLLLFNLRNNIKDTEEKLSNLINVKYLVLDDIGLNKTTEWLLDTLYLLVNERYNNGNTTIFTSNLELQELKERYGDDRIVSRIASMCDHKIKMTTIHRRK